MKEKSAKFCNMTAAISGVEGIHALEGDMNEKLDFLYHERGLRLMSLHHFFDNEAGKLSTNLTYRDFVI